MSKFTEITIHHYAFIWLKLFTAICLVCSALIVIMPRTNHLDKMTVYDQFAFLLPFIHFAIWAVLWVAFFFFTMGKIESSVSSKYIKERYPKIWKKLHPWGDYSCGLGYLSFLRGKFDNGTDQLLNQIKNHEKARAILLIWPLLLVVGVWIINVAIIIIKIKV